jgi:hypothetical protein
MISTGTIAFLVNAKGGGHYPVKLIRRSGRDRWESSAIRRRLRGKGCGSRMLHDIPTCLGRSLSIVLARIKRRIAHHASLMRGDAGRVCCSRITLVSRHVSSVKVVVVILQSRDKEQQEKLEAKSKPAK